MQNKGREGKRREYFGLPPLQFFKPCKGRGSFSLPFPSLKPNRPFGPVWFEGREGKGREGKGGGGFNVTLFGLIRIMEGRGMV